MRKIASSLPSALVISAILAGCDGGGGLAGIDGTGAPAPRVLDPSRPETPVVSTVTAYGTVTGFGSVWVNGVRYDTSRATFTINGRPGTQSDLDIGDVVRIVGSLDAGAGTGVAQGIVFDSLVQGPISAIDTAGASFVALGQTVEVDARTALDDAIPQGSLAGLRIGDVIEVSGFRSATGSIKATRVEVQELGRRELETTGPVTALDDVGRRFRIDGLVVDYSIAMLEAFPRGAIAEDDTVEVRGSSLRGDGTLVATSVERRSPEFGVAGNRVEIEGYITSPYPRSGSQPGIPGQPSIAFSLEQLAVETTGTTVFEGGYWGNLWYDIRVEVEGILRSPGALTATKIRFSYVDPIAVTARVDSVNTATGSFTTLGIPVKTDALTRVIDLSAASREPFHVTDLVAGDYVSVRGIELPANSGEILASVVERRDSTTETEVKGFMQSATWHMGSWAYPEPWFGSLRILGVTFVTNENTLYGWNGSYGLSGGTFFFDAGPGVLIEARGVQIEDRTITATHLMFAK